MKILHIMPSFYPAYVYGGPVESCFQLCRYLAKKECEVRVLTTDGNGTQQVLDVEKERDVLLEGMYIRYCRRSMGQSLSLTLLRLLSSYIRWADLVHLTAVYSFPTLPTLSLCAACKKPVIWSPRGSLSRWEGSTNTVMKLLWEWACRTVAPEKLFLHMTSEEEVAKSRKSFSGVERVVIPNGVEIPVGVKRAKSHGIVRLLYLGRLHPSKGIENLLAACKLWNSSSTEPWSLTIAGAGDPYYTKTIRDKIRDLALLNHVEMTGHVTGNTKQALFERTDIVVVPSYTESFGLVVAEALAHSVPVIASKGSPWKRLEEIGCGYWVDNDPESLARAIQLMTKVSSIEMGQRGRAWMVREFGWESRTKEMMQLYSNALAFDPSKLAQR